jgi:DNA-binding response OmpR family regulator
VVERILIVEDEPEFAALLELWIGRAGYDQTLKHISKHTRLRIIS